MVKKVLSSLSKDNYREIISPFQFTKNQSVSLIINRNYCIFSMQEGNTMKSSDKDVFVKVTDVAGNEFICPIDALKERTSASKEELENCVDNGVVGRYASNIDIED